MNRHFNEPQEVEAAPIEAPTVVDLSPIIRIDLSHVVQVELDQINRIAERERFAAIGAE